jgi:hypothetical protein
VKADKDLLIAARAKIEAGWCKGTLFMLLWGKPHFCAAGALDTCLFPGDESPEHALLRACLPHGVPNGRFENVAMFNDLPATSMQDVLDLYDRAIAAVDGAGASRGEPRALDVLDPSK